MIHIATPKEPTTAACGDASAKRFTFWRWKSDCALCKAATAAVSYEVTRSTSVHYPKDRPIRFSALVRFAREHGIPEPFLAEFERDRATACAAGCSKCKSQLPDPVAILDVEANRMVFACPFCSEAKVRARWEKEEWLR